MNTTWTIEALIARVENVARLAPRPVVIGITGPPGAGKSTLAERLTTRLEGAALLPADGFHLTNAQLDALGRRSRKGAPDTFDVESFTNALALAASTSRSDIYVPAFDRTLDEPRPGAIRIPASTRIVVVEGNYLLCDDFSWSKVHAFLSESWYLSPPDVLRESRLLARHQDFGKPADAAANWVRIVDRPNAELIDSTKSRADIQISQWT